MIFLLLAAPDFFGNGVTAWTNWAFLGLAVAYYAMLHSRRGAAVLGRPTHLRGRSVPRRIVLSHRLIILVLILITVVGVMVPHPHLMVPYWRTITGVVLGGGLALFGSRLQSGVNTVVNRADERINAGHGSR
ncbi:hypothetical protein [Streptomyces sp. NBC_01497]|uniref:hypothetical protein n=1 Tax=Streptomyces sp. NBC_01497 TaxID=2903885 RepID=UPI002E30F5F8|nr:hypothetical protein [Streptomyces sp. NBC_01497]